ncbi:hypothetical protein ACX818_001418 [Acinetobacter baumannii]
MEAEIIHAGMPVKSEYPQMKRWQTHNTFALFSSPNNAMIVSADINHENDYIGKKVEDPLDPNWIQVQDFAIVIRG